MFASGGVSPRRENANANTGTSLERGTRSGTLRDMNRYRIGRGCENDETHSITGTDRRLYCTDSYMRRPTGIETDGTLRRDSDD
jgi:hypothetical protein